VEIVVLKNAKLRIALAGAGLLAAIAIPLAALAYPPSGWERVYYDDAAHTTNVGEETMYCTGKKHLWWGTVTPYFDQEIIDCNDPPPDLFWG
jgi:hypothetical protein